MVVYCSVLKSLSFQTIFKTNSLNFQVGVASITPPQSHTSSIYHPSTTGELSESRQQDITLREVDPTAMELLIKFVYIGSIEVSEENVQVLLPAANLLQLIEVSQSCCDFLRKQLDPTNVLGIISFADLHSCPELLGEAQRYARKHFPEVRSSDEFVTLSFNSIVDLISSDELGVLAEEDVFEAVIQWVKHNRAERESHLADLIRHIRYELLSSNYVLKHVAEEEILNSNPGCKDFIINALKYHLMSPSERAIHSRQVASRVRVGGPQSIVIVGGQAPKAIRNIEVYDVKNHVCKLGPELVSRRCRCGVTVLNGSVYAVGGFDGTSRVRCVCVCVSVCVYTCVHMCVYACVCICASLPSHLSTCLCCVCACLSSPLSMGYACM